MFLFPFASSLDVSDVDKARVATRQRHLGPAAKIKHYYPGTSSTIPAATVMPVEAERGGEARDVVVSSGGADDEEPDQVAAGR
jgi:hypothetical protein